MGALGEKFGAVSAIPEPGTALPRKLLLLPWTVDGAVILHSKLPTQAPGTEPLSPWPRSALFFGESTAPYFSRKNNTRLKKKKSSYPGDAQEAVEGVLDLACAGQAGTLLTGGDQNKRQEIIWAPCTQS